MKTTKGKFIVIDGSDASGKRTQTECLKNRFEKEGFKVLQVSFPHYHAPSATMVELYLHGKLGDATMTNNPYLVSTFYAADRYLQMKEIIVALENGQIVISDRYVTANMGHQGGKINSLDERKEFFEWLYDYEYNRLKIPKPDLNLILHVPMEISQKLIEKRGEAKDIHENDPEHLRRAEAVYLELPQLFPDFKLIECCENGELLSIEKIHEHIWQAVNPLLTTIQ